MYEKDITRNSRAAIVIAIDQSSSMSGKIEINGWSQSKAEAVSMVTGRLIEELLLRSRRDNGYRDYYDIALVGYSENNVYPLFGEELEFYPITTFAAASRDISRISYTLPHITIDKSQVSVCEEVPMWVKPRSQGNTPMYKMLNRVTKLVSEWCAKKENSESFPPLVFNVTDGEASDASYDMLQSAAKRLRSTGTADGNTLLINIHLSSDVRHQPIIFPTPLEVPDSIRYATLLMEMSSIAPERFHDHIKQRRSRFSEPPYVAMSYNSSISELIAMLNIGTRSLLLGK